MIKCSTREKGKYTSITLKVHVNNSTQLYKVNPLFTFLPHETTVRELHVFFVLSSRHMKQRGFEIYS